MPWMPVNSDDNKGDIATVILIAVGLSVMLWLREIWVRPVLYYCFPAAIVVALVLRYWYKRHSVDLIQLGYKDKPRQD